MPYLVKHFGSEFIWEKRQVFREALCGQVSVFYRFRAQFHRMFVRRVGAALSSKSRTHPVMFQYKVNKPSSYFEEMIREYENRSRYNVSRYTPLNEALFSQCVEEILRRGIEFIVIDAPTHPKFHKVYDASVEALYQKFLAGERERLGFTYLTKEDLPPFSESDFIDFLHLNESGRGKLSKFIEEYFVDEMPRVEMELTTASK